MARATLSAGQAMMSRRQAREILHAGRRHARCDRRAGMEDIPFCERDTVPEIEIAVELDDADVQVVEDARASPWPEASPSSPSSSDFGMKVARSVVTSIEGRRLVRLARQVVVKLSETARAGHLSEKVAISAIRLAAKSARITGEGYAPSPADCLTSIVPGDLFVNILHLEGVVARLEAELAKLPADPPLPGVAAARAALDAYRAHLDGWSREVPFSLRDRFSSEIGMGAVDFTQPKGASGR